MKALWHVLGWFTLAVLVIGGYLGLLLVFGSWSGGSSEDVIVSALGVVSVVLYLALAGLGLSVIWAVARLLFPRRTDRQDPGRPRLVALAVSALLFPQFFTSLGNALATAGESLLANLARPLNAETLRELIRATGPAGLLSTDGVTPLSQGVSALCGLLQTFGLGLGRFLAVALKPLGQTQAVRVYVVWLVVLLLYTGTPSNAEVANGARLARWKGWWLHGLRPRDRHHVYQGVLFLLGCYLSIAAMVAIPSLQKPGTETVATRERLQTALQTNAMTKEEFDRLYPEDFMASEDPLSVLETFLAGKPQVKSAVTDPNQVARINDLWQAKLGRATTTLNNGRIQWRQAINEWRDYRRRMSGQHQSLSGRALSSFDIDILTPLTTQERVLYLQDVVAWHRASQEQLRWVLLSTLGRLEEYRSFLQQRAADIHNELVQTQEWLEKMPAKAEIQPYMDVGFETSVPVLTGGGAFESATIVYSQPKPPEPGVFVGPFAFVARWLLHTRSYSLALITGMIGFGLFGASITSLVRVDAGRLQDGDARGYASRAVMQGFAAAVVIFLAAQGGLVLLAGGDAEPNGYALCFICLIGAVFSERVWRWAEERLRQTLTQGDPASPADPAQPQAQATPDH